MSSTVPDMCSLWGLSRNQTASATALGVIRFFKRSPFSNSASRHLGMAFIKGVRTIPGATALTRMYGAKVKAHDLVKPKSAVLVTPSSAS